MNTHSSINCDCTLQTGGRRSSGFSLTGHVCELHTSAKNPWSFRHYPSAFLASQTNDRAHLRAQTAYSEQCTLHMSHSPHCTHSTLHTQCTCHTLYTLQYTFWEHDDEDLPGVPPGPLCPTLGLLLVGESGGNVRVLYRVRLVFSVCSVCSVRVVCVCYLV